MRTIATTEKKGLTVAQVGGNEIYKQLHLIQDVISLGKLDGKHSYTTLFAEPQEHGSNIDWWYTGDGTPVSVMKLPPEERQAVLRRFREMIGVLQNYTAKLRAQNRGHADILAHAVVIPNLDYLYAIDGNPVMICWGFWEGDNDLVEETKKLIKQIDTTIADAETMPQTREKEQKDAPSPDTAAGDSSPAPAPTADIAAQETSGATQGAATDIVVETPGAASPSITVQITNAPSPPKMPLSRLLLFTLGALAVLLAIAAWYFLKKTPLSVSPTVMDVRANGVLANENDEAVDLRLHFVSNEEKGISYIIERGQTCQGTATARVGVDNTLVLEMDEVTCPNQNHYEPFSLVCVRNAQSCAGMTKTGDAYQVDVKIEGELAQ